MGIEKMRIIYNSAGINVEGGHAAHGRMANTGNATQILI